MQYVINAIIAGSAYALLGLGFALVLRVARFIHFAHGAVYCAAPYVTLLLKTAFGLSLGLAAALAVLFCGLMGGVIELLVYRRLRHRGSSSVVLLLASLGVYIALQNSISLAFGDGAQTLRSRAVATSFDVFGAKVTQPQVLLICATAGLAACVAVLLARTRIGRVVRAVASDPELAGICGVGTDAVILWTFVASSMLAGVAGVLVCLDLDMTPTMGMHALLMAVVAVVVGGSGNIWGILLGGIIVGGVQQVAVWGIGAGWQDGAAFLLLVLFMLGRARGFPEPLLRPVGY